MRYQRTASELTRGSFGSSVGRGRSSRASTRPSLSSVVPVSQSKMILAGKWLALVKVCSVNYAMNVSFRLLGMGVMLLRDPFTQNNLVFVNHVCLIRIGSLRKREISKAEDSARSPRYKYWRSRSGRALLAPGIRGSKPGDSINRPQDWSRLTVRCAFPRCGAQRSLPESRYPANGRPFAVST